MAIKYNNKQVKVVKFDNNDVKKIIKDGTTVWIKPYTLTENSFDNSLVTYTWTETEEPSAGVNKTVTKSVPTSHYDMRHTSTVFNNDTLKVTYPSSGSKVVDVVRVDGKLVSNNGTFTVTDDVEVVTASRCTSPVSLTVKLDQGINYLRIEYMSKEGQHKYVELEDSANYTISDIWTGSIVEFRAGCKSGHMLSSNTTHTLTDLRKWNDGNTVSNVTEERTWYQYVADKNASLTIVSELQPAYLTAYWPSSVASLFIKYTNDNDEEKTITLTSSMATGTTTYDGRTYYKYQISNIKYATSYYYTITPVSGTTDLFPILEDYEAMRDSYQSLWIYPNYQSATIKLNWDTLDTAVKAVSVIYKRSDIAGTFQKHFTRRNGYSTVSDARKNTLAELGHFDFTHAGCRVDETDGKTKLFLDKNENIFQDVTIEQLDLDERPTPITVVVPSNYSKIVVYYITTSGEETSQEFYSTGYITDAAEGSYFNYEGYLKNGTVVYGYYWIYKNGSGWSYTHIAPDGTTSKGNANTTSSSGGSSGGSSTVTNNTITPPNITTYTPPKVENPVYRDVEVVFNDYVKYVYVDYYTCDANGYLVNEWYRIYPTDAASKKKFKALVGYNFYWKAYGEAGCLPSPEWESFRMSEIATAYQISPVAVPTPGTIRVVVSDGVKDITVKYYDVPSDEVDTQNRTETFTSNADITDALIGTRYSWTATAKTGTLQKSSGSGRVSKYYYESMIAPELDTEPYTLYFDHMPDTYQKWEDYRHDAGPDDILRAESDGSNALRIVCRTASGTDRWDNIVTIPSDSSEFDYEGTPTVAIYDKSNTKLLDLTTANSYTLTDSSVPNNKLYIKASGGYIAGTKTYTVKLPTKPTNATTGYMHTSSTSTVGLPEDTAFEYGTTVYYFLVYPISYYNYYDAPSGWTKINTTTTHVTYRVDSASVNEDCPTTSPFDASGEFTAKTWKVTLSGDHVYWTSNNKTVTSLNVYTGCTLSVTGTNTITCKAPGGTTLWDAIAIRNTDTAQYSYSGIPEIEGAAFFPIEITADTTIKAIKITRSIRTYSVTLSPASLTAVSSLFLAEDSMATTGSASGSKFDYNKTVYGIAKVPTSNLATYAVPSGSSGWTYKQTSGDYAYYTVGSVKVDGSPATGETISVSALTVKGSFTITLDGTGLVWKQGNAITTSMTAYKNDTITRVSSTAVACSYMNASGGLAERWRVTVSRAPDTNTTTYSGTPSIPAFSSWTVTSDKKLSELFTVSGVSSATRKYTVTWKTQDGTSTYETDSVAYNTGPDYNGATPGKTATAQYNYTFAGWSTSKNAESGTADTSLPKVTGNVTYYAAFSKTVRKYTITWKNADGTTLETDKNVEYGTTPTYNGSTPTKAADTSYTYTFAGWSPSISTVTGDKTYTATYSSSTRSYTITFKDSNAATWSSASKTAYPGDALSKQTTGNTAALICSYKDSNGNLAQRWKVSVLIKSATAQYTYTVNNWDFLVPSSTVNGDMTVTAPSGSVTTNKYTVKIVATTGISSTFISTSATAKSGTVTTSGASMNYSTTTYYGFVKVLSSTILQYNLPTTWERIGIDGSYTIYKVWSGKITGNINYNPGSMTPKTGTVTVSKADYMYGIYLSTSATTAPGSGSASGSTFNMGTTVYAIAMFTSAQYSAISSKPSTWGTVNYNGSYYYCSVGSVTVIEGANTITYTDPTFKSKHATPSISVALNGAKTHYIASVFNNAPTSATVTVTFYNASTGAAIYSGSCYPGSYSTATVSMDMTKATSSIYAKATAVANGYTTSDPATSTTVARPELAMPTRSSYSATAVSGGYSYSYVLKNSNPVAVTARPEFGLDFTIPANSTASGSFTSTSNTESMRCYVTAPGWVDSDINDWYFEYSPPSTGDTTR